MVPIIPMAQIRSHRNIKKKKSTRLFYTRCNEIICVYFTIPTLLHLHLRSQLSSLLNLWSATSTSNFFFFLKKNQGDLTFWLFRILVPYFTKVSVLELAFVVTMLIWSCHWIRCYPQIFNLLSHLFSLSIECPDCVIHVQIVHMLNKL